MGDGDGDLAGHTNDLESLVRDVYQMARMCSDTPGHIDSNEFAHWFMVELVDQIEQLIPSVCAPSNAQLSLDEIPF